MKSAKTIDPETKRAGFNKEFRAFIEAARKTIKSKYEAEMELGKEREEYLTLEKYYDVYKKMDASEHYEYFIDLYEVKRIEILGCLKDDRADQWIRMGNIVIQLCGKIGKKVEAKFKDYRIMVSAIFLIACDQQLLAEQNLGGGCEEDLLRPNILLLHLMRIFYYLNENSDQDILLRIVAVLENQLQVADRITAVVDAVDVEATQSGLGAGISGLFELINGGMTNLGIPIPDSFKKPDGQTIEKIINTVTNDPSTKETFQGMLKNLVNNETVKSLAENIQSGKGFSDPSTTKLIQESLAQTAEIAQNPIHAQNFFAGKI